MNFSKYLYSFKKEKITPTQERTQKNQATVKRYLEHLKRKPLPQRDPDVMWAKMKERIEEDAPGSIVKIIFPEWRQNFFSLPRPVFIRTYASVAFVLLIVAGSLFLYKEKLFKNAQNVKYIIVKVENGQRANIELIDGTTIIADAGSEIRYPARFKNQRDIYLKGEAYFEVASNRDCPFYVHANHALVRVVGTKFNVRAWSENPMVTVSVNSGKVSLSSDNVDKKDAILLTKDEMGLLAPNSEPQKNQNINAQDQLAWMRNEIKFDNASVEEVLAQLQRWYDYKYVIQDSSILKERVTVHILKTNIKDVLEVISLLTNTKIEKESNCIRLNSKTKKNK